MLMKTDEELKQIAKDLYAGQIFTDRHVSNPDLLSSVFMVLAFMQSETKVGKTFYDNPPALIYEYMDKAGPMGINGMPMFTSFCQLDKEECDKMFAYYEKVKEAMDGI